MLTEAEAQELAQLDPNHYACQVRGEWEVWDTKTGQRIEYYRNPTIINWQERRKKLGIMKQLLIEEMDRATAKQARDPRCESCGEPLDADEKRAGRDECFSCYCIRQD